MTPPRRIPKGSVLAGYLRRSRLNAGYSSQEKAADAAGVDRSQWNAWETGRRGMGPENVEKVAMALGVAPDELYELAEEPGAIAELAVQLSALDRRVAALEELLEEQAG